MTPTIRLSVRQHSLLYMDVVDVGTTPQTQMLGAELMVGRTVSVTGVLLAELREFCDRDDDPAEHRVYLRLMRKAKATLPPVANLGRGNP
jgi:hypothetical protein